MLGVQGLEVGVSGGPEALCRPFAGPMGLLCQGLSLPVELSLSHSLSLSLSLTLSLQDSLKPGALQGRPQSAAGKAWGPGALGWVAEQCLRSRKSINPLPNTPTEYPLSY